MYACGPRRTALSTSAGHGGPPVVPHKGGLDSPHRCAAKFPAALVCVAAAVAAPPRGGRAWASSRPARTPPRPPRPRCLARARAVRHAAHGGAVVARPGAPPPPPPPPPPPGPAPAPPPRAAAGRPPPGGIRWRVPGGRARLWPPIESVAPGTAGGAAPPARRCGARACPPFLVRI